MKLQCTRKFEDWFTDMIKTGNGRIVTIQESLVVVHNNLKSLSLFMSGICTFDEI